MAKTTESQLVTKLREQLRQCSGWDGDKIETDRKSALDYYFQRPRGDEVPGASKVVSGDLSSMVEATLAQMMDAFSSNSIVEFDAFGKDDEYQAKLESDAVSYFVMCRNNGFLQFLAAIKDALLLRNGIVKVWVEDRSRVVRKRFRNVSDDAVPELVKSPVPGIEVEPRKYDPAEGTLDVRITKRDRAFKVEALPLENFLYPKQWDRLDLQDVPFCAERHLDTRSDLVALGFPRAKVDALKAHRQSGADKVSTRARSPRNVSDEQTGVDTSQDIVEWYECYLLMDHDGDGIAERRMVALASADNVVLANKPARLVPYAAGAAIINPHRFTGISLYDKLRQIQDVSTGLQRGLLDNVTATNKPRVAYLDGLVNPDDLDNGRVNASVRVRKSVGDVARAVSAIIIPDASQGLLQNLEYQRSLRAEMGGASLELATGQMQLNDRLGSQGLDRAYSVMEQLAALMTRTVAASLIRSTFLLAHATLRETFEEPTPIKYGGRWQTPTPTEWPERAGLTVKVGMSPGERQRLAVALGNLAAIQERLASQGMDDVLVNLESYYALALDWCRVQDIRNPEQYFVDPRSDESVEARKRKAASAQQQTQAQQAFLQQAVGLEQIRTAMEKYKTDVEMTFKYWSETLRAQIEEAKIVGTATTQLLTAQNQPREVAPGKPNGQADTGKGASK
jgi:hypothetical protein